MTARSPQGRPSGGVFTNPYTYAPHQPVTFFQGDGSLARLVAAFLTEGFAAGNPGIVVATGSQRTAIVRELTARSVDVESLQQGRDLLFLDAHQTLSAFMVDGYPDPRKFRELMYQTIESMCLGRANCTVRIFGQMVDLLWQQGQQDAAIRLEVLLNQLAQTEAFSILSCYAVGNFYKDATQRVRVSVSLPDAIGGPSTAHAYR